MDPMRIIPARNPIRKRTRKTRSQRRRRQEHPDPDPDLMPQVKEAQEIGDSGAVAGFEESEEEARGHHAGERGGGGLQRGDDAPAHDAEGGPYVRREDLPHEREPLEDDVRDVEDC